MTRNHILGALQPFETDDRHCKELPRRTLLKRLYWFTGAFRPCNFRF
jgi:hypothetical protein